MRLEMSSTRGQLGMQTTQGRFDMESPKQTLDISTTQPQTRVEGKLAKITIDQSQCFADAGLMGNVDFTSDYVNYAKSKMYESMGRISEQGTEMANIQYGGSAIADQALYNAYDQFMNAFNYGTVPRSRPRINVIEGSLDIRVTEGRFENRTKFQKPTIQYQKGSLRIYVATHPSLNISTVDERV